MKKTLLAAALIAGFAGAAQAETSVTLYGIVDAGIGYTRTSGNYVTKGVKHDMTSNRWGMANGVENGSRWGMKGTEDLGDGLQAVFQLESGFDPSTGDSSQGGRLFGRQATIGLQSANWGRLDFGRQTNIASKFEGAFDPFMALYHNAEAGTAFQSANTYHVDNMIQYQTPDISGFRFGIGYSGNANGSITGSNTAGSQTSNNSQEFTTGLRYTNGPIDVTAAYDLLRVGGNVTGNDNNGNAVSVQEWHLGGSYDFEVVKAYLAVGQMRNGLFGATYYDMSPNGKYITNYANPVMTGFRATSYLVDLSAPIANGRLMFSWQGSSPGRSSDFVKQYYGVGHTMNSFGLGYAYSLSKRTDLYALGTYTHNAQYQDGLKTTELDVGIRHMF